MKTLFRILFLQLALALLFTQCEDIEPVYITDIDFFNALIEAGVDVHKRGSPNVYFTTECSE